MGRFKAMQQLTRCARRLATSDSSSLVPARLLSNSQASTSAADGSEQSHRPAGRRDVQKRQPSEHSQRPGNAGANPQAGESSSLKGTGLSGLLNASDDFEPGFVADGAYPHAASEVEVTHLGGSTETAWEFLGSVDEQAVTWFGMDFTRGTHPEVERNALLSDAAKEMMYQMHTQDDKRYAVSQTKESPGYACLCLTTPHTHHLQCQGLALELCVLLSGTLCPYLQANLKSASSVSWPS